MAESGKKKERSKLAHSLNKVYFLKPNEFEIGVFSI
jgi:hypothetical protein